MAMSTENIRRALERPVSPDAGRLQIIHRRPDPYFVLPRPLPWIVRCDPLEKLGVVIMATAVGGIILAVLL